MTETIVTGGSPNELRRNSLGLIAVTFMVISAAAPLTGVAGAMPLAFLLGNGAGIPLTFVLMTLIMLAFAVGYVAMARYVRNAGAFYAYAARGLGGTWGGAVSFTALVAYNAMQFGLVGLLGGIAAGVFGSFGIVLPWWGWSLIAVLLVGFLGYRQVDLSAKVMIVLVALEYLVVFVVDFGILGAGGAADAGGLAVNIFDMDAFFSGSLTAAVLFCLGSFIGFEATTIYAEEARDPERTIPRATYLAVFMIGLFFVFTTWLMVAGVGAANLTDTVGGLPDPTDYFFMLADMYVGGPIPAIAGVLLVSSLFAALSAFHNYIARYTYVAGRDGLLPSAFGRTHDAHQSPHIGSVTQTIGALIVLAIFAGLGLDPIQHMFTWISQIGTLGVLGMMTVTSLAVMAYFRKTPEAQASVLARVILPLLSAVIMAALFVYIFMNFGDLTGTTGGSLGWILPSLIPVGAIIGYLAAARLRSADPAAYEMLGSNRD
ncbi:MAG: APC family permease [Rhodobacter sp.]|uniref:APC family permease n=1 Tax=Pararhodobacter sp. TaxID=2127056 RepID=UPI001D347DE5|nr:APC family permease [Pararhodobacter sp.]MCB1346101.1 APC family permease [Paracoccaceae bacterium]MCC0073209.1 APC family permease [Rhodobacter sp.]HPD91577.1 APC family permease [Pararhodobacter sp.]